MSKNIIFLHIPKTAGQSIDRAIRNEEVNNYIHLHGSNAVQNNIEIIRNNFTFCFVRNPWDRMVSNYFYIHKMYDIFGSNKDTLLHNFRVDVVSNTSNFKEFVYWVNNNKDYTMLQFHMIPQMDFIKPIRDDIDFIGRYENLNSNVKELSKLISIKIKLLHLNKSEKRQYAYQKYYNKDTKKIVADLYSEDIEILGYKFGD